jgi:hypothetical protein
VPSYFETVAWLVLVVETVDANSPLDLLSRRPTSWRLALSISFNAAD